MRDRKLGNALENNNITPACSTIISNSFHPKRYFARPGDGSVYTCIESVEMNNESVKISILVPDYNEGAKRIDIVISDHEVIKLLPSLLGGKISCFQAMLEAEGFLRKKHKIELASYHPDSFWQRGLRSADPRLHMFSLLNVLLQKEAFADLCHWFPHDEGERKKPLWDLPVNVVSDEILDHLTRMAFQRSDRCKI